MVFFNFLWFVFYIAAWYLKAICALHIQRSGIINGMQDFKLGLVHVETGANIYIYIYTQEKKGKTETGSFE